MLDHWARTLACCNRTDQVRLVAEGSCMSQNMWMSVSCDSCRSFPWIKDSSKQADAAQVGVEAR